MTQRYLKEILQYCELTGIFTWKLKVNRNYEIGEIAGTMCNGYVWITIKGRQYSTHRLAFLYMNGSFPKNDVDHIDRNRSNNKWNNLREATTSQNMANAVRPVGKSGFKGVRKRHDVKYSNPWTAQISIKSKLIHLGYFKTAEEAAKAYDEAAIKYFGEFAKLNFSS